MATTATRMKLIDNEIRAIASDATVLNKVVLGGSDDVLKVQNSSASTKFLEINRGLSSDVSYDRFRFMDKKVLEYSQSTQEITMTANVLDVTTINVVTINDTNLSTESVTGTGTFWWTNASTIYAGGVSDGNHRIVTVNDLSSAAGNVVADLSIETSRAQSAEASLAARVSSEESRATSAEASLTTSLSSETSRAQSAETSLTTRVSTEESRATSAETSLTARVSAEESRATSAEASLDTRVSAEESRAQSAEASLTGRVSAEESRAQSAESSLTGRVSAEESRAQSAEASLTMRVSTEESRAQSAETSLTTRVSTEESRATSAEDSLSARVLAEEDRFIKTFLFGASPSSLVSSMKSVGDVQAASFTTTSDGRLKIDVVEVSSALETVSHIRPVFYNWIDARPTINPGYKELGFIAQELEAVVPSVVRTEYTNAELPDKKTVAYDRLVALLVASVKELSAEIAELKRA